jgi:type III secretory pathway component EscT
MAITQGMPGAEVWLEGLQRELARGGLVPSAWLFAAARVLPSTLLVPAFGLGALPTPARVGFAFILAASVAPALALSLPAGELSVAAALGAIVAGLPVAVGAAAGLWVAAMAGNLLDALRGNEHLAPFAGVGSEASPLGVLLSLGAAVA